MYTLIVKNMGKQYYFVCQVPHLQIMGLEEKEQMFTTGDPYLDMGEDINIRGLQIIRFEIFYYVGLHIFPSFHVLQRKTSTQCFMYYYRVGTLTL